MLLKQIWAQYTSVHVFFCEKSSNEATKGHPFESTHGPSRWGPRDFLMTGDFCWLLWGHQFWVHQIWRPWKSIWFQVFFSCYSERSCLDMYDFKWLVETSQIYGTIQCFEVRRNAKHIAASQVFCRYETKRGGIDSSFAAWGYESCWCLLAIWMKHKKSRGLETEV